MDWGAAEVTAYASLLDSGFGVRISGQDVRRGTFSHRHVGLADTNTGEYHFPIEKFKSKGAELEVWNSALSELAVLGFEYGYSLAAPKTLTVWEAQFGDFSNGAQIVIDQFISSAEYKWDRMSGVMMSLPHGYEGQGPEHSSGKPERFLQLCAQDNMTITNVTTPAQIFHLLRRQGMSTVKKPLVNFSPKSLLRHPMATSSAENLTDGQFQKIIDDVSVKAANVKKIVFCTGKIYYDLLARQTETNRGDVAIVRLEQLYPMAYPEIETMLAKYVGVEDIVWAQEEPRNQGWWTFIREHLEMKLPKNIRYVGRVASAAPAVGSNKRHNNEQMDIVDRVFV
jgi:2-oxoglutarate dehydrogenase E1 component